MIKKEDKLTWIGIGVLIIYNILLIPNLFSINVFSGLYDFYNDTMGTVTLLEFMILAGVFGSLVVNYEKFKQQSNMLMLGLTGLSAFCFFLKIVFFFLGGFEDLNP